MRLVEAFVVGTNQWSIYIDHFNPHEPNTMYDISCLPEPQQPSLHDRRATAGLQVGEANDLTLPQRDERHMKINWNKGEVTTPSVSYRERKLRR